MTDTAQAITRRGRLTSFALVLACAALLWAPDADRDALRAQGVARLLRADAERARGGEASFLAALAEARGSNVVGVGVRVDGVDVDPRHRIAEAIGTALRNFGEGSRSQGAVSGAEPSLARLEIDVRSEGDRVALEGRFVGEGEAVRLPAPEPVFLPGRAALLPPLLAIGAALIWRRTLPALFLGILAGSIAMAARDGAGFWAPLEGFWNIFAVYLWHELTNTFRFEIIGFIVALLGMVGVMSRAGGMAGLVERSKRLARGARSGQAMTWLSGLFVFFDDYANCMLVGSTLRPVTDRLRISREKLAYLVDSTAAPVAGLSLLSTWIAYQVSVFAPQLPAVGIETSAYVVFVASLPYRFYCWLTLAFVGFVALSGRDFGPMRRAEMRARRTGEVARPGSRPPISNALARMQPGDGMPAQAWRALLPIAVILLATVVGIAADGGGFDLLMRGDGAWRDAESWRRVLLDGSGAGPIFRGAVIGLAVAAASAGSNRLRGALGVAAGAAILASATGVSWVGAGVAAGLAAAILGARLWPATRRPHLRLREIAHASAVSGPTLAFASALLFEAWMIGAVCEDLGTADYLVALLADALAPRLLPVLLFVVAALVAFSTGSSWSTMAILLPNAVPLASVLGAQTDLGGATMVVIAVGAVLDGAIFGDHCSPISDTTVLSSVASGCDHLDHVRTQAPYALCVAGVALLAGHLPILLGAGWGPWTGLAIGLAGLFAVLAVLGRKTGSPSGGAACPAKELP